MVDNVIPLDKMVDYDGNFYEMTNAMVKRADMLTKQSDKVSKGGRICSESIRQVLDKEVDFSFGEE